MDIEATAATDVGAAELLSVVSDLSTYQHWLGIIGGVEVVDDQLEQPVWSVALQAAIGPLRRSKKLRMARTRCDDSPNADGQHTVIFARAEIDGKNHSPWVLTALVDQNGSTSSTLTMRLHYGGSLFVPMLDRILRAEIETSRSRLRTYLHDHNAD